VDGSSVNNLLLLWAKEKHAPKSTKRVTRNRERIPQRKKAVNGLVIKP
jgi:hypothetical protein